MEIDLLSEEFISPSLPFRESEIREIKDKIERVRELDTQSFDRMKETRRPRFESGRG